METPNDIVNISNDMYIDGAMEKQVVLTNPAIVSMSIS